MVCECGGGGKEKGILISSAEKFFYGIYFLLVWQLLVVVWKVSTKTTSEAPQLAR